MKPLFITSLLVSSTVFAQQDIIEIQTPCYPTQAFIKEITEKHGEAPVIMGKSVKETNTVIWLHPKTKAYTITTTIPAANKTCVLDSGQDIGEFGRKPQQNAPAKKAVQL